MNYFNWILGLTWRHRVRMIWLLISLLVIYIYLYDLGQNPYGLFCDEAMIGVTSLKYAREFISTKQFWLFYEYYGYVAGALSIYSTMPFTLILGLSDFSVRLGSTIYMLGSFGILGQILKKLQVPYKWTIVLLFAFSPVVIHIGRINLGHSPSIFLMVLGVYLFLLAKERTSLLLSAVAGFCMSATAYGYMGFFISAPLFIFTLCVSEVWFNRRNYKGYCYIITGVLAALVCWLPIFWQALFEPHFWHRLADKAAGDVVLMDWAIRMLENYPKYYDLTFLFQTGEINPPYWPITRHSVLGAGLLLPVTFPLILAGVVGLFIKPNTKELRAFLPFFILLPLYPIPDLLTTRPGFPPYTFSIFSNILWVPFTVAYGVKFIENLSERFSRFDPVAWNWRWVVPVLTGVILVSGIYFYFVTYQQYPLVASDYWGWQSGPKEMIGYFVRHEDKFDEFYMEHAFNGSDIFFHFYIVEPSVRQKTFIGGVDKLDPGKRQLFGVGKIKYEEIQEKDAFQVRHIVKYPDGSDAFYLIQYSQFDLD